MPLLRAPLNVAWDSPRSNQQAISFLVSYATHTVLLPLEIFTGAFVLLCLVSTAQLIAYDAS